MGKEIDLSIFDPIIGKDENIIEAFKPNKKRDVVLSLVGIFVFIVLISILPICMVVFSTSETDEYGPLIAISALDLFIAVFAIITVAVGYKQRVYCYTNKRIIIRNGIIGADFQTLDYDLIGGISVTVGLFDKMVNPNTGIISFASAALPVANGKGITPYVFKAIENPYEVCKRIKVVFDEYKEKQKQK